MKRIYAPWIENIIILIKWRDEAMTKKKARAIQRAIDKKISIRNVLEITCLRSAAKEYGVKLSAWSEW